MVVVVVVVVVGFRFSQLTRGSSPPAVLRGCDSCVARTAAEEAFCASTSRCTALELAWALSPAVAQLARTAVAAPSSLPRRRVDRRGWLITSRGWARDLVVPDPGVVVREAAQAWQEVVAKRGSATSSVLRARLRRPFLVLTQTLPACHSTAGRAVVASPSSHLLSRG